MKAVYLYEEIQIPEKVTARLEGTTLVIKGPKGEIKKDFGYAKGILMRQEGNKIINPLLNYRRSLFWCFYCKIYIIVNIKG